MLQIEFPCAVEPQPQRETTRAMLRLSLIPRAQNECLPEVACASRFIDLEFDVFKVPVLPSPSPSRSSQAFMTKGRSVPIDSDTWVHVSSRPPKLRRDTEFWFADGSIVLITGFTAFRVHQSVLSSQSEVFRGLFAIPQPGKQERISGCPCIQVHDSPSDLRYLLRVLYKGGMSYLSLMHKVQLEFAEVAALVRLGHKYMMADLVKDGLARMKTVFTDDFKTWDVLDKQGVLVQGVLFKHTVTDPVLASPFLKASCTDAVVATHLAHATGALTILPAALYLCCQLDTSEFLRGQLCSEDVERCVAALAALSSDNSLGRLRMFFQTSVKCEGGTRCNNVLYEHQLTYIADNHIHLPCTHVLQSHWKWMISRKLLSLCDPCKRFLISRDMARRLKCWDNLPAYLGLGTWDELRHLSS